MAKKLRIDKMLSNLGYGTRTEIKRYLKNGMVELNDIKIKDASFQVDPEQDEVKFDGQKVNYREFIYLMMNKPDGYISATSDKYDPTVLDILDKEYLAFEPFPVGRLDKDTEGLLVLTNDGKLAHRVLSPKKHVKKIYYAEVRGNVTEMDVDAFAKGVKLDDDYECQPGELKILETIENGIDEDVLSKIELTIYEGKFHQVKRMFESVDKEVVYLKRISMGKLELDENLELGEYRELTDDEVKMIEER